MSAVVFPLFDHGQKSNNINRCLIGQNRLCQIQDSNWLMENMRFSHDISQVSHCRAILSLNAFSDTLQLPNTIITSSNRLQLHNM